MDKWRYRLTRVLKYHRLLYRVYFGLGSMVLRLVGRFLRIDQYLVLFNSYGGKEYNDNPRAVYEYMSSDSRFSHYHLVWAFHEPSRFTSQIPFTVKVGTIAFFIAALKARCWITNTSLEYGLSFKQKGTFYVNTGHGTPLKKTGRDLQTHLGTFQAKADAPSGIDLMPAQSQFEADILAQAFGLYHQNVQVCGFPRNDEIAHCTPAVSRQLKDQFGLSGKRTILYAPTFREYEFDDDFRCVLKPPIDFSKWQKELGRDTVVLFRAHHEIAKVVLPTLLQSDFVLDVSVYPNVNELMMAADVLVTDYSSIMFDFSILRREMFLFQYDYEKYVASRGVYFDVRLELPSTQNEDELIRMIASGNSSSSERIEAFRRRHVEVFGNATISLVDAIAMELGVPS